MAAIKEGLRAQREGNARLTRADVIKIRELAREGYGARSISKHYGVGMETIRRLLRGDTWAWVIEGTGTEEDQRNSAELAQAAQASMERVLANNPELAGLPPKTPASGEEGPSEEALAKARLFGNR